MPIGLEPKVFVSMMSAPASKYCRWISSMTSGCVRLNKSTKFFRSLWCCGKTLPAYRPLVEPPIKDHRSHRAIKEENSLRQQTLQLLPGIHSCSQRHVPCSLQTTDPVWIV